MAVIEFFLGIWGYIEPVLWIASIATALWVFFNDPIRRARFLGYIPTAVPVVFDRGEGKVLICKLKNRDLWILPQGRIEESLLDSVREVLFRELGLERAYKLLFSETLGVIKMRNEYRMRKFRDSSEFTLARSWRGKAYVAFFVESSESALAKELEAEFLYEAVRFVSLEEAQELLCQGHRAEKKELYQRILTSLRNELED